MHNFDNNNYYNFASILSVYQINEYIVVCDTFDLKSLIKESTS